MSGKVEEPPRMVPAELKELGKSIASGLKTGVRESRDPREMAYKEIVGYLFDTSKLLMVSRLNEDLARTILRNKIVIYFFHDYYAEVRIKIRFERIEEPPFYMRTVDYTPFTVDIREKLLKKYPMILDDVLAITVSLGGAGRGEALDILRADAKEMEAKAAGLGVFGGRR
jgi:hypothetical protein